MEVEFLEAAGVVWVLTVVLGLVDVFDAVVAVGALETDWVVVVAFVEEGFGGVNGLFAGAALEATAAELGGDGVVGAFGVFLRGPGLGGITLLLDVAAVLPALGTEDVIFELVGLGEGHLEGAFGTLEAFAVVRLAFESDGFGGVAGLGAGSALDTTTTQAGKGGVVGARGLGTSGLDGFELLLVVATAVPTWGTVELGVELVQVGDGTEGTAPVFLAAEAVGVVVVLFKEDGFGGVALLAADVTWLVTATEPGKGRVVGGGTRGLGGPLDLGLLTVEPGSLETATAVELVFKLSGVETTFDLLGAAGALEAFLVVRDLFEKDGFGRVRLLFAPNAEHGGTAGFLVLAFTSELLDFRELFDLFDLWFCGDDKGGEDWVG